MGFKVPGEAVALGKAPIDLRANWLLRDQTIQPQTLRLTISHLQSILLLLITLWKSKDNRQPGTEQQSGNPITSAMKQLSVNKSLTRKQATTTRTTGSSD